MTMADQRRAWVLAKLLGGELSVHEVAVFLGLSERSVWRLRARFAAEGPAALVHGNRGRPSGRRVDETVRARVVELARTTYAGANDTHLAELLAEREGITLSRVTVRRILRADGQPSPRKRRAPRHRSRRDRMPQAGLLVQVDGSRHDWLEDRGPRLTLVGGIDDATGILTAATFRDQEDTAGYLEILRDTVRRHGIPGAWYRDRHGIFETPARAPLTLEEQLADTRTPTQLGRALEELGVARSPPAAPRPRAGSSAPGGPCRTASSSSSGSRVPVTATAPTGCSPATCPASTGGSRSLRPTPSRPGGRCRPGRGSSGSARSGTGARSRATAPCGPGPRSCSSRPGPTDAAGRASGSSSSCDSTGGSSSGTGSATSSPPRHRLTRSSSGRSRRPEAAWAPRCRPAPMPSTPGAGSGRAPPSTSASDASD